VDSPAFRRHKSPAKWEKGSFTLPNRLVQNKNLTDSGFRLLAWMVSCSDEWTIYQTDIMARFEWGREKLKTAIDNLIDLKYLIKLSQRVLGGGRYGPCDYEFCPQGFTDEEIKEIQIISPMSGYPTSDDPTSDDPTSKQIPILTNPNLKDVCKREDPPLENSGIPEEEKQPSRLNGALVYRHVITPPKGEPIEILKEEIYRRSLGEYARNKWTNAEIADAWESLINSRAPIISPWRYLEKTIEGIRMALKKKQQAQYCKRNSVTTNSLKDNIQCQQAKDTSQIDSTKKSESSSENFAEKSTSGLLSPSSFKPIQLQGESRLGYHLRRTSSSGQESPEPEKHTSKHV